MDTNKMREQFEAAYVEEMATYCGQGIRQRAKANLEWRQENGDYRDPMLRLAYWAWEASRKALVVELPPKVPVVTPSSKEKALKDTHFLSGSAYNQGIENCQKQIEAAGLKVAP